MDGFYVTIFNFYTMYQSKLWIAVLGILVCALVFALKIPIKKLTTSIKVEKYRKLANTSIILINFIFGVLFQYIYSLISKDIVFNLSNGLQIGTASLSVYAFIERFIYKKTVEVDEDAETIADKVEEITADGEVTVEEIKEVGKIALNKFKEFLDKN